MIGQDLLSNPQLLNTPAIAAEVSVKYLLDRCKAPQTDPGYVEKALQAVGYNTPDIKAKKKGYYECFLGQLQGTAAANAATNVKTGGGTILRDSQGNPVSSGG
jgi:hypothetical protein